MTVRTEITEKPLPQAKSEVKRDYKGVRKALYHKTIFALFARATKKITFARATKKENTILCTKQHQQQRHPQNAVPSNAWPDESVQKGAFASAPPAPTTEQAQGGAGQVHPPPASPAALLSRRAPVAVSALPVHRHQE